MSNSHYFAIHELLNQLPPEPIEVQVKRPHHRRRPRVRYNGIYFMYQQDETFKFGDKTYERIVYVGIGNLKSRLNDYARINVFPPLKQKIERALAAQKGVLLDAITPQEVDDYVKSNFTRRILRISSADEAQKWERTIIPTVAQYSADFISRNWLGRWADLPYGILNTEYTSWPLTLQDKDLLELSELIKTKLS